MQPKEIIQIPIKAPSDQLYFKRYTIYYRGIAKQGFNSPSTLLYENVPQFLLNTLIQEGQKHYNMGSGHIYSQSHFYDIEKLKDIQIEKYY